MANFSIQLPYVATEAINQIARVGRILRKEGVVNGFDAFPRRITVGALTPPTDADRLSDADHEEYFVVGYQRVDLWYEGAGYARATVCIIDGGQHGGHAYALQTLRLKGRRDVRPATTLRKEEVWGLTHREEGVDSLRAAEAPATLARLMVELGPVPSPVQTRRLTRRVRKVLPASVVPSGDDEFVEVREG